MPTSPKPRCLFILAALTAVFVAQTVAAQSERSDVSCLKISPAALDSYANEIAAALKWATADARSNGVTGQYAVAATNSRDLLQRAHQSAIAGASALRNADPSVTTYAEAGTIKEHVKAILEVVPQAAHWSIISAIYHNSSDASRAFEGTIDVLQRGNALFADAGRCYMGLSSQQAAPPSSQSGVTLPAPLFHFSLDSPDIDGDAKLYVKKGNAAPTAVSGPTGNALYFTGAAAVATPFNLDVAQYPQTTVTAWVKRDGQSRGSRTILSGGDGAGILLGVNANSFTVKAGPTGVSFNEKMPTDKWVFVAAVVDTANGWARLHQDDGVYRKDNIKRTGKSRSPRLYANPVNPEADKEAYLFVGARQFRNWRLSEASLAIDDVRVYAGVLTVEQINAIRRESAQLPGDQFAPTRLPGDQFAPTRLPGDQFDGGGPIDGLTVPPLPGVVVPGTSPNRDADTPSTNDILKERADQTRPPEITYGSEEEAQAAADRRARERGQAELDREQNELEAQRRAEASNTETGTQTESAGGDFFPTGAETVTGLSGVRGGISRRVNLKNQAVFMSNLRWYENSNRPCAIYAQGSPLGAGYVSFGDPLETFVAFDCTPTWGIFSNSTKTVATNTSWPINSIRVCFNSRSKRLKGIAVSGEHINPQDTANSSSEPVRDQEVLPNCSKWGELQNCPTGQYATGVVVEANDLRGNNRAEITGLRLICHDVGIG